MSKKTRVFLFALLSLVTLWLLWPMLGRAIMSYWLSNWSADNERSGALPGLGQFGDMFGALTALFTVLAFLGVAFTAWLQHQALQHQQQEIKNQQQVNTASLQLSALTAILNSLHDELSAAADDNEKHFLKSERARTLGELREMLRAWPEQEMRLSSQFLDDGPVTPDELVREITSRFPYIPERSIRDARDVLINQLISVRINSVNRFRQVMNDLEAIGKTQTLYMEELNRPPYRILDRDAIVTWPAKLHLKSDSHYFEQLRLTLRTCQEAHENRKLFSNLPLVPLDEGRTHRKVQQPCIAVVQDRDVEQFPHFNEMKRWFDQYKPQRTKLFIFDCDVQARKWIEVSAEGEKV